MTACVCVCACACYGVCACQVDFVIIICVCVSVKDFGNLKIDDVEASLASEICDELSDDDFTKPLVLAKGELNITF